MNSIILVTNILLRQIHHITKIRTGSKMADIHKEQDWAVDVWLLNPFLPVNCVYVEIMSLFT